MKIFVYVMTHVGDPNEQGCWGCSDCMKKKRGWDYDTVIGVGGVGAEKYGFRGKVKWIGKKPTYTKVRGKKGPLVTFEHFRYFGNDGPDIPSRLAARVKRARRGFMIRTPALQTEAEKLRNKAKHAPPSQPLPRNHHGKKAESGSSPSKSLKRRNTRLC